MINSKDKKTEVYFAICTISKKLGGFTSVEIIKEELSRDKHKVTNGQYKFIVNEKPVYVLFGRGNFLLKLGDKVLVTNRSGNTQKVDSSTLTLTENPIFVEALEND